MTIYDDAKAKLATAQAATKDAADTLSAAQFALVRNHVGDAGVALSDAQELLAGSLPKPVPAGLWTRDKPVAMRTYDPAYPGFIGRVNWRDLEPVRGTYSSAPIDQIRALAKDRGKVTAIRFYSGGEAPDWAKQLGGPVSIYNPTDKRWATVGAWWRQDYQQAYAEAIQYIATQVDDDPLFLMVCCSLGGMLYPEPFLRSIGHAETHANLAAAGLTTNLDHVALQRAVKIHAAAFKHTRSFLSFNPGQDFDKRSVDEAWSREMIAYVRAALGDRGVLYSTSLDAQAVKAPAYQRLYSAMKVAGGPRAIQTEQTGRVDDWDGMMRYGTSLGFQMVETSAGGWEQRQTVEQAKAYSSALASNARGL
jgi:hypothetical protein